MMIVDLMDLAHRENINQFAIGAIIIKDDKYLLFERKTENFADEILELPTVKVEKGENLPKILLQKFEKEINLVCKIKKYVDSFDYISQNGIKTRQFNFLVDVIGDIKLVGHKVINLTLKEILASDKIMQNVKCTLMKCSISYAEISDISQLMEMDRHISPQTIRDKIKNKEIVVIKSKNEILGLARYNFFWDEIPFINLLMVKEGYRNKKIGTVLIGYFDKFPKVLVSTQQNETAQFFYRKLGYIDIGNFRLPQDEFTELILYKENEIL